ncbi:MAG: hypothetical protein ACM31C_18860, partial [Acidobacteriota bacterium]
TAAMWKLAGGREVVAATRDAAARLDAPAIAVVADAAPPVADAPAPADAAPADAAPPRDAGRVRRADAARAIVPLAIDAAIALPPPADAAPVAPPPDARERGSLVVKNDTWCDVKIDGTRRGRNNEVFAVDAGRHVVVCEQPGTANTWTRDVVVVAGQLLPVTGAMLGTFAVTLDVDTTIDGAPYKRGAVVRLKAGSHEIGQHWVDVRGACTVKADLECYP